MGILLYNSDLSFFICCWAKSGGYAWCIWVTANMWRGSGMNGTQYFQHQLNTLQSHMQHIVYTGTLGPLG